jgi:hypothetical protein
LSRRLALGRPRHPIKEFEAVLRAAESQGWTILKAKKYFKMLCPCEDKHLKTMHLTPSNPMYLKNLLGYLIRVTCWEE